MLSGLKPVIVEGQEVWKGVMQATVANRMVIASTLLSRRELLRLPDEPKPKPPAQHQAEQQPKERRQKGRAHAPAAPDPGSPDTPATHLCPVIIKSQQR